MRKLLSIVLLVALISVAAQAAPTLFTYNSLGLLAGEGAIGQYMTNLYGSKVVVDTAVVWKGDGFGAKKYITRLNSRKSYWDGNIEIKFKKESVKSVRPDWFGGDDTSNGYKYNADDARGKKIKLWSEEVTGKWRRNKTGGGTNCDDFGGLVGFPDGGVNDGGGIENPNENWAVIPAPGAVLLGSLGIGIVGWLRQRASLV